jgi:hypothetical protein
LTSQSRPPTTAKHFSIWRELFSAVPPRTSRPPDRALKPGACDDTLDFKVTDFRQRPALARVGKGEQGVERVEPYKGEILPHWRFRTVAEAKKSSARIYKMFLACLKTEDFPGADMARKFLRTGWTRARRYANHTGGRK